MNDRLADLRARANLNPIATEKKNNYSSHEKAYDVSGNIFLNI